MNYTITTLVENIVYGKGLQGEHGLSLLIEAGEHKILFDTGASDLFTSNARVLGANLRDVDFLVLSHGHRDHTGGLQDFLELNTKATIICKKEALCKKYKNDTENGMPFDVSADKDRFRFVTETTEIVPGVFVLPNIKIVDRNDTHFEEFFVLDEDGEIVPDTFEDELALVLTGEKNISILSSCSHRGITNIVRAAQEAFPEMPLHLVLGGFHIHTTDVDKFNVISGFFGRKLPKRLGTCHCTGVEKYALFRQQFNDRVYYNYAGWVEKI